MKISYSKYNAWLQNPERYRMYYVLGLTPEGDETPTNMNLGRRRGRCFHALLESRTNGTPTREEIVQEHGAELVERCERMIAVVPDLGPMQMVEQSFELPIGDGKHSILGRLDHVFTENGAERVGDFKTTKGNRTKADVQKYFGELSTSSQAHFYLYAAAQLGHATDLFTYHVIFDRKDKESQPKYVPIDLVIGSSALARTMAGVYAACEAIEFLTSTYGTDKPWPHSNHWPCCGDQVFCGYAGICGRAIPKGCVPPGFTTRWKEQLNNAE